MSHMLGNHYRRKVLDAVAWRAAYDFCSHQFPHRLVQQISAELLEAAHDVVPRNDDINPAPVIADD